MVALFEPFNASFGISVRSGGAHSRYPWVHCNVYLHSPQSFLKALRSVIKAGGGSGRKALFVEYGLTMSLFE